ncbi:MAG: hypothetical protein ACRC47_07465 [Shewanella sp.]
MNAYQGLAGDAKKLYAFVYAGDMINQLFRKETIRVKIGETVVAIDDRISGQTKGSGNSEQATCVWQKGLSQSLVSSDHQVHKMLVDQGIARRVERDDKKSTEWFDFIAPSYLVKMARNEDDDRKTAKAVADYLDQLLNKTVVNIEKMLAPEPVAVYNDPIKTTNHYANEFIGLRQWYKEEIEPLDLHYVSGDKGNQPYVMSFELVAKVIDKAALCPHMQPKILVIECIEIACALVKMGYNPSQIHFTSTSEKKRNDVEEYGVWTIPAEKMINLYKKGNLKMKFNACIQNPPYEQGLHVDFVNLGAAVSDRVVAVHPSTPIINRKEGKRQDRDLELVANLDKFESSVDLYNGFELFSAEIEAPISVTYINKHKEQSGVILGGELVSMDRVCVAGAWANKFFDLISKNNLHSNNQCDGKFYVNQCWKRGGHGYENSDFYTMIPADKAPESSKTDKTGWLSWGFETEQEAQNFIAYCKTKFARFMLSLYKVNGNIHRGELVAVPWVDFTQTWDDEKLFKLFKVSKEDQAKINEFIPDYY